MKRITLYRLPFYFLFCFFVFGLCLPLYLDFKFRNQKEESLSTQEITLLDSTRQELIIAKPGDIVEFKDGKMARVYMNMKITDSSSVSLVLHQPGLPGGRVNVIITSVKHVYHRSDPDWRNAAERFVLQDLPKEGQEKSVIQNPDKMLWGGMPSWI